jgi:hypothetical protein
MKSRAGKIYLIQYFFSLKFCEENQLKAHRKAYQMKVFLIGFNIEV